MNVRGFYGKHYATLKNGGIHTKILISHQQLVLNYQTRYQANPWAQYFNLVVRYANNLIFISTKTLEMKIKSKKNEEVYV